MARELPVSRIGEADDEESIGDDVEGEANGGEDEGGGKVWDFGAVEEVPPLGEGGNIEEGGERGEEGGEKGSEGGPGPDGHR
jgi:hypothetical protein